MEWGLTLLLSLLLVGCLLPRGPGQVLEVDPPQPEVVVQVGGSQQLTCRLACPGRAASVQWRGLDTSLGAVRSGPGVSVLSVRNASLAATGTHVCVGSCGTRTWQHTVRLLVFAFPDQLSVSPAALISGQDQELACTAHNVTPADPSLLFFSLLLGEQELEGAQAEGWDVEAQGEEDPLFHVTKRWLLPPLGMPAPPRLHCRATMQLPGLELSWQRAVSEMTASLPGAPLNGPRMKQVHFPDEEKPPTFPSLRHLTPMTSEPPTHRPCRPEILQPPALAEREAPWELLCTVACSPEPVVVRWTRAPGGVEAYEQRGAGTQRWLKTKQVYDQSQDRSLAFMGALVE
ncbi:mucosal addressin cell adhesion molecule 1 [Tenrec ecaudatus]|uniref:mucosal addressin cell adhesion molecule 1 n=1 Tax=Tenrec ecaudatus TaxID=94439 RepID=UPI003F598D34